MMNYKKQIEFLHAKITDLEKQLSELIEKIEKDRWETQKFRDGIIDKIENKIHKSDQRD